MATTISTATTVTAFPSVVTKTRMPNEIETYYAGTHLLRQFKQTIATPVPCAVFYDPDTQNIQVIEVPGVKSNWLLIEVLA